MGMKRKRKGKFVGVDFCVLRKGGGGGKLHAGSVLNKMGEKGWRSCSVFRKVHCEKIPRTARTSATYSAMKIY